MASRSLRLVFVIAAGVTIAYLVNMVIAMRMFESQTESLYRSEVNTAQVLSHLVELRSEYSTYYRNMGGLPETSDLRIRHTGIEVNESGDIVTTLTNLAGNPGKVVLQPVAHTDERLRWRCFSQGMLEADLLMLQQDCADLAAYQPLPVAKRSALKVQKPKALSRAIEGKKRRLVRQLLKEGVDVNAAHAGKLPLQRAIAINDSHIVGLLLEHGADPRRRLTDGNETTFLMVAARKRNAGTTVIRKLLKHGADIDDRDRQGRTALMHAASADNRGTAQLLLQEGAAIDAKDRSGKNAVDYAAQSSFGKNAYHYLAEEEQKSRDFVYTPPTLDLD